MGRGAPLEDRGLRNLTQGLELPMTTPTNVSPLRQRMIEDMVARRMVAGTQVGHIRACKRFAAWLKRSPETATADDLRSFQLHLSETGVSAITRNRTMTGLRFLFRVTLRRLDLLPEMYFVKEPQNDSELLDSSPLIEVLSHWSCFWRGHGMC